MVPAAPAGHGLNYKNPFLSEYSLTVRLKIGELLVEFDHLGYLQLCTGQGGRNHVTKTTLTKTT